jgi:peroxiredoxin
MGLVFKRLFVFSIFLFILNLDVFGASVRGSIANAEKQKKVYLFVIQGDMIFPKDSMTIKGNKFEFKSKGESFPRGMYKVGFSGQNASMVILSNEDVEMLIDAKAWEKAVFKNSAENKLYAEYRDLGESLKYQMRILDQKYQNLSPMAQTNPQGFQAAVQNLRKQVDSLMRNQQEKIFVWKQTNPGLFMTRVLEFNLNDAAATPETFITNAQLEDEELLRTDLWENRVSSYFQRFGENDADKWVILADQVVTMSKEKTISREIALRSAGKALLPLEQNGLNAGYDLAKRYTKEFPGPASSAFIKQFTPGPPAVGEMAPDIQLADKDGKIVPLSSMKGKVVLLDFWASWCGPCRMENPNVLKAYNHFKDKGFTVFSVSLDQNKDKWQAAIAKDGLVWENHVSDLKGWGSAGAALYQVRGIPATFLLDKNGKIIAKNLRGSALDEKLKELLGP